MPGSTETGTQPRPAANPVPSGRNSRTAADSIWPVESPGRGWTVIVGPSADAAASLASSAAPPSHASWIADVTAGDAPRAPSTVKGSGAVSRTPSADAIAAAAAASVFVFSTNQEAVA